MAKPLSLLVAVKRCVDYATKIRVLPDRSGVDLKGVKFSMNPFCEIAIEEALRLKERGVAASVHAVTVGPLSTGDVLRTALALGADRATHVVHEGEVQPLGVAHVLAALARRDASSLILFGKQAIDDDCGHTGQLAAALLGWPQGVAASALDFNLEQGTVDVAREGDAGQSTVRLWLPAVLTADLRLNQPRFATLAATLRAKKAPIERITPAELNADTSPQVQLLCAAEPPKRPPGVRVRDVDELVTRLSERGAL